MNLRIHRWRIFFTSILLISVSALAEGEYEHKGQWGIRLSIDPGVYGGYIASSVNNAKTQAIVLDLYINRIAAGSMIPAQLEATYDVTNALELFFAVKYGFSSALVGTDIALQSALGATLGFRYFINPVEPVKAYIATQLGTTFMVPSIEGKLFLGLQWDINKSFGIFLQPGIGAAALLSSPTGTGLGAQIDLSLGTGLHYHF